MNHTQPSMDWLSSLSVFNDQARPWIPDPDTVLHLDTGWQLIPADGSLHRPDRKHSDQDTTVRDSQEKTAQAENSSIDIESGPAGRNTAHRSKGRAHESSETMYGSPAHVRNLKHAEDIRQAENLELPIYFLENSRAFSCYPWDGEETLRPGQIPQDNQGFWLLHELHLEQGNWMLGLEGIEGTLFAFLNDRYLGMIKAYGQNCAFTIPQDAIQESNELALLLYPCSSSSWLEYSTLPQAAGIQDVCIQKIPEAADLERLEVRCEVTPDLEEARIWIEMDEKQQREYHVVLQDPRGQTVLDFESSSSLLALDLYDLSLWSMEIPDQYTLTIYFLDETHQPVRKYIRSVGLRRIEDHHSMLMLNGKQLTVKGLYLVDDFFFRNLDIENCFRIWKQNHVNAVYIQRPVTDSILEAADRFGIAVFTDLDLHTGSFGSPRKGFERQWKQNVSWRLRSQWLRLSCHACVLGIRETSTVFPDPFMEEQLASLENQDDLLLMRKPEDGWKRFTTLERAEKELSVLWDRVLFFEGTPSLESWEVMQKYSNLGGLFLLEEGHPWHTVQWSMDIQDLYTPWKIEFEKRGIRITNQNVFRTMEDYEICWTSWNGDIPSVHKVKAEVSPQRSRRIFLSDPYDWRGHILAEVCRIHPCIYAEAGYAETSCEHASWSTESSQTHIAPLRKVYGEHFTTFYGQDFEIRFDEQSLLSIQWKGQELLGARPEILLWDPFDPKTEDMCWQPAWSLSGVSKMTRSGETDEGGWIRYDYVIPTSPRTRISVTYSVSGTGVIGIDAAFKGSSELPPLGAFGYTLPLLHPQNVKILNDRHLRRAQTGLPGIYHHMQGAEVLWKDCTLRILKIAEDMKCWAAHQNTIGLRFQSRPDPEIVWMTVAAQKVEYEASLLDNDAFRRTQLSFLIAVRDRTHPAQSTVESVQI